MKIIYGILTAAAIMLAFYGLAAFVTWETNPGKWDMTARFLSGFMGLSFGTLGGAFVAIEVVE